MHCCACIGALACSSMMLVYNLQSVFQQACKHTGLQLVSACDCFTFWSWDATLWHICLYSALRLGLFGQFAVYEIVFSNCMSSSSSYPRQLFSGQNSSRKTFCDCRQCVFPKLPSFVNIHVEQSASQSKHYIALQFFKHGLYE